MGVFVVLDTLEPLKPLTSEPWERAMYSSCYIFPEGYSVLSLVEVLLSNLPHLCK